MGAGLTGGLLILIAAGLQAFLFWTLFDILALLLMLERRTRHGLRLELEIADKEILLPTAHTSFLAVREAALILSEAFYQPEELLGLVRTLRQRGCRHILMYSGYKYQRLRARAS